MARAVPWGVPTDLVAGDSWAWNVRLPEFPPSEGWSVVFSFGGQDNNQDVQAAVSPNGLHYEVRQGPAFSEDLSPGPRIVAGYATKGTEGQPDHERFRFYTGTVRVHANLDQVDQQLPFARRALQAIEAAMEGRLTKDLESFQIAGRTINKIPIAELRKLRGFYRAELNRKARGKLLRSLRVRFPRVD